MNALEDLAAEALTWYAKELRQQSEFCAYMFDEDGQRERLDKAAMIDQMLAVRPTDDRKPDPVLIEAVHTYSQICDKCGGSCVHAIEEKSDDDPCECNRCVEADSKKIPVGFAKPNRIVGLPKTSFDVV